MSNEREWMELAVTEAGKSKDEDDRAHPRVGVVVVKDGKVLAAAFRGEFEAGNHGEFTALEKKLQDTDVSGATVYATLEPCTTRNHPKIPCAERLIERRVKRVVIGMLDPNQEIRGRGEWRLMESGIEIGRFDHDLTKSLMDLNREFIRSQQRLGLKITFPENGAEWRHKVCVLRGTYVNPPGDNVLAITNWEMGWWPQPSPIRITSESTREWEVPVDFGIQDIHKVYVVKANPLGMQLVHFYRKMKRERKRIIQDLIQQFDLPAEEVRMTVAPVYWPLATPSLPKGLDPEDCITINVVDTSAQQ
jgi:pyrimidine deaminase RibD-like protein